MGITFHTVLTNENSQQGLCPPGPDNCCKYHKCKGTRKVSQSTQISISGDGNNKNTFRVLKKRNLLQKCLNRQIQNPNESVNSKIWTHIPKTVFVEIKTLHFGV
jgi:hypothetical protein